MSEFDFSPLDYADSNNFLVAAGERQTNTDRQGNPVALKTTHSQGPPKQTLTVFSVSDAAMNSALMKPEGAMSDIYNRVGQDVIASGIAENGGVETVLGAYTTIAPTDLILKANALPTSMPDLGGGVTGSSTSTVGGDFSNANMGDYPPPSGEYRSNDDMRRIYGLNGGMEPPHGPPQITSFTWWNGRTYQVNAATVPVWTMVDAIMKKYNYGPRPEETGGGGYNRRLITNGSGWSLHAYGIAVDINPTKNPYSRTFQSDMPPAMVEEILQIKTKSGVKAVRWGGHYKTFKDAMHYEVMVTPKEIQEGLTMGGQAPTNIAANRRVGGTL